MDEKQFLYLNQVRLLKTKISALMQYVVLELSVEIFDFVVPGYIQTDVRNDSRIGAACFLLLAI
jgi:hypothetical protein